MNIVSRSIIALFMMIVSITASAQELRLFSPELRGVADYYHQMVMDFVERYFGKELPAMRHTTLEHKMADDKVYLRKGTLSDLNQIADTMPVSISLIDRFYEVKWLRDNEPFVSVVFPAQYDLLTGLSKEVAQSQLKQALLTAPVRETLLSKPDEMEMLDDSIWQSKTDYFELKSLNDAIYYNKVYADYRPVYDNRYQEYSAANLFHGLISDVDYRMYVEQSVYGMKTINYTVSLQQWLNYCAQLGLKIFFAVEEQREDGLLVMIVAQCRELGFNHLLSVVIPDKFVTDKNAVFKVRLTPYIPTHNVKDLYKKQSAHLKKKVWQ